MTHQLNLSLEAGRIANVINGKSFAIIGGRSNENHEDLARGKLLFEAYVLRRFQGAPIQIIPFAREHPMPPGLEGSYARLRLGAKTVIDYSQTGEKYAIFVTTGDHLLKNWRRRSDLDGSA